jgi:hypothetical protein
MQITSFTHAEIVADESSVLGDLCHRLNRATGAHWKVVHEWGGSYVATYLERGEHIDVVQVAYPFSATYDAEHASLWQMAHLTDTGELAAIATFKSQEAMAHLADFFKQVKETVSCTNH